MTDENKKRTTAHLTDKVVKNLPVPETGYKITYDDEIRGFGIQVSHKGRRTFILNYSIHGRERRYKIGEYGDAGWSMAAARQRAKELKTQTDMNTDLQGQKDEERAAPTLKWLYQEYERLHLPTLRPSSQQGIPAMWRDYILPKLGHKRLKDLGAKDIDELHRHITSLGKATRANRVIENLRSVLNQAIRWDMIDKNPAAGFRRNREEARDVYLTQEQVQTILKKLKDMENRQAANVLLMLLLTGARLREVTKAEWSQFDFERGMWIKPSSHTKQKRKHELPLSPVLIALLQNIKRTSDSPYVFPSDKTGKPIYDIRKPWKAMVSALTLFGLDDMMARYASYEDMAEIIRHRFVRASATLKELFGRLAFNILIGNTDDHARNHAAFWDGKMLSLTPAYDICPQPRTGGEAAQAMLISGNNNLSRISSCLEAAKNFHLSEPGALAIIESQMACIRKNWLAVCDEARLSEVDRNLLWGRQIFNPYAFEGLQGKAAALKKLAE